MRYPHIFLLAPFLLAGCSSSPPTAPEAGSLPTTSFIQSGDLNPQLLLKLTENARDASDNKNHGLIYGDVEYAAGCIDQAIVLDGEDDYVKVPYHPALEPEVVSVEVYFKPDADLTDGSLFVPLVVKLPYPENFANRVDGYDIAYQDPPTSPPRIGFGIGDTDGTYRVAVNAFVTLTNRFHHVVGTYDLDYLRLYVDGELVATRHHTQPIAYLGGPVYVGGNIRHTIIEPDGRKFFFSGMIDEVAIYDYVLTPEQVAEHAQRCRGIGEGGSDH